ncbi:hypothetical protein LAUMK191_04436 [Mycobacterium attenuatum]|uniref:Uncharacterized protein n=1 Tax=Mycobacterium attenuatum TaxID=2341086 RepID=A0A498QBH1_9MYCO|nr:hypothetical protein LAUMK136_04442 [Mycobacterium attenuatum]VBA58231.1 hypothetical protein LAUMK191_04436 [Mycobacterium attenuatum]
MKMLAVHWTTTPLYERETCDVMGTTAVSHWIGIGMTAAEPTHIDPSLRKPIAIY